MWCVSGVYLGDIVCVSMVCSEDVTLPSSLLFRLHPQPHLDRVMGWHWQGVVHLQMAEAAPRLRGGPSATYSWWTLGRRSDLSGEVKALDVCSATSQFRRTTR